MVQWLKLCTPNAWGLGSIPGQELDLLLELKTLQAASKKKKKIAERPHLRQLRPSAAK